MRFYSDLATQRDADMPCKCRPRRISHGNTSARRAFASIMTAFLGGAIFVAEVYALSVVPRFEVAVLNRKFVAAESAAIASNHNHVLLTWVRGRCFGIKAHSTRSTKGEGQQLQGTGCRPSAIAGTTDSRPSTLERYDESAFCCSRVGHAACQPDLRSDRQQSDLWRLRLGTKLPLLWCESITRMVRGWVSRNTHDSVGIVRTK